MTITISDLIDLIGTLGAGTMIMGIVGLGVWSWAMRTERNYWRDVAITMLSASERGAEALETMAKHVTRKPPK